MSEAVERTGGGQTDPSLDRLLRGMLGGERRALLPPDVGAIKAHRMGRPTVAAAGPSRARKKGKEVGTRDAKPPSGYALESPVPVPAAPAASRSSMAQDIGRIRRMHKAPLQEDSQQQRPATSAADC